MTEPTQHSPASGTVLTPPRPAFFGMLVRAALPLGILAVGVAAYFYLSIEPKKVKAPPAKPQAIRTRVKEVRVQDYPVIIKTQGVVRPHSEVTLTAQVSGRISRVHPGLEDGAFFVASEVLLELDAMDYETALVSAEAQVARAPAAFKPGLRASEISTHTFLFPQDVVKQSPDGLPPQGFP